MYPKGNDLYIRGCRSAELVGPLFRGPPINLSPGKLVYPTSVCSWANIQGRYFSLLVLAPRQHHGIILTRDGPSFGRLNSILIERHYRKIESNRNHVGMWLWTLENGFVVPKYSLFYKLFFIPFFFLYFSNLIIDFRTTYHCLILSNF